MIGRNPLTAAYYNPLGRSPKSWADDRKRVAAIEQLNADLKSFFDEKKKDEVKATFSRLLQLGAEKKDLSVSPEDIEKLTR